MSQWHPGNIIDVQEALAAFTGSALGPVHSVCRTYKNLNIENDIIMTAKTHQYGSSEIKSFTYTLLKNAFIQNTIFVIFIYLFNTGQHVIKLMVKVTTVHEDKDKQDSERTGTRI